LAKIGKINGAFFQEWVARCTNDMQGIFFECFYLESLARGGEGDKTDVRISRRDRLIHFVGATIIDLNFDLGEGFQEIFDLGREFVQTQAWDSYQTDRAGNNIPHFLQLMLKTLVVADDFATGFVKELAFAGQGKLFAGAFQKGDAESDLDRAELLADGRLGNPVQAGRTAKGAGFD
jgi:hypothetical protein